MNRKNSLRAVAITFGTVAVVFAATGHYAVMAPFLVLGIVFLGASQQH